MKSKFCRDCGEDRPVTEFTRNRNSRDGYAFYCRAHARRRHQTSRDRRTGGPKKRHPRDLVIPEGHKWCPDCGQIQPLSAFGRNAATKSGLTSYCKPCHNARGRRAKEFVGGERTYHLRRRYGITAEDADLMLERQGGLCAICRAAPAAHVDHDHETGAVRALLCFNCNGGLGQFKDDPVVLRAAADYIEEHRRRQPPKSLRHRRIEVTARSGRRQDGLRIWRVRHQDLLSEESRVGLASLLRDA
jgi:hypothetical protein